MSTRKKVGISDLLRDEVQKDTEVIEVKAETVNESAIANSSTNTKASNLAPNKDQNAKITALESELAEFKQREADLQKDLQFSKTNVELLQKSLAAIESLKNELDQQLVEVKRDNLRLAESNIQLSEQVKALEAKNAEVATNSNSANSSQLVTQPEEQSQQRATPRKQPVEQPYARRDRNPYYRPTGSNEQLQRVNNKNIGWMD